MTTSPVQFLTSRDNPLLKDLRRLAVETTAYRKQGRYWVEGVRDRADLRQHLGVPRLEHRDRLGEEPRRPEADQHLGAGLLPDPGLRSSSTSAGATGALRPESAPMLLSARPSSPTSRLARSLETLDSSVGSTVSSTARLVGRHAHGEQGTHEPPLQAGDAAGGHPFASSPPNA